MQRIFDPQKSFAYYVPALSARLAASLLVLVIACAPADAAAAISYIQGTDSVSQNKAALTATYASAQTAGDMNIVVVGWDSATITLKSAPVDSKGNTYKLAVSYVDTVGITQAVYYAPNIAAAAAGANTVTATLSASTTYPDLRITEYSGVNSLDKVAAAKGTATTASSGAVTTTQASELLFGTLYNWGSTSGAGTGYTQRILDPDASLVEDRIVTSKGSYSATAPVSGGSGGEWLMQLATFYSSAGSAPMAPTGLTAAVSSGHITLNWTASAGASSYNVLRSTTSGSGYAFIATGVASPSYTDSTVNAATTYYYVIQAVNSVGTSGNSSQIASTTPAANGTTYYVSPQGSNSNSGSSASPWATIGYAATKVTPGSTVIIEAGTYPESVTISTSGTSAAPIVFQAQAGAIIDGHTLSCCSTLPYLTGTVASGQLQSTQGLINIGSSSGVVNYVTVEGLTVQNFTTSSTSVVPAGIFVATGGTGIIITGNTITNISSTATPTGTGEPNSYPVGVFGTSSTPLSITFSNNIVTSNLTGQSEAVAFNGNVQNFQIFGNKIYGNDNIGLDVEGFFNMGPSGLDQPTNGDVFNNLVYENSAVNNPGQGGSGYDADGIYCDGCKKVVIEQNTVYANDYGIEAASENNGDFSSDVIIRNNLVYGNNSVGISVGGYSSAACSGDCGGGGSQNIYILNNTLYDNQQSTGQTNSSANGEVQVQYRATGIVVENNIVDAPTGWFVNNLDNTDNTITFGHNDYYTTSASVQFTVTNSKNVLTTYTSASSFDNSVGDTTSIISDPQFDTLPSCTFTYTPIGGDAIVSEAGFCSGTTNFDIPSTSAASSIGTTSLGTPSGSAWSAYQESQPYIGSFDYAENARVNSSGKVNLGAYEQ